MVWTREKIPDQKYTYSWGVLKLLGAICIALLHYDYQIIPRGYLCVELFFVINGMLIAFQEDKYQHEEYLKIVFHKLKSLYFYYIILVIISTLSNIQLFSATKLFNQLLFFPYIGFDSSETLGFIQIWYLPVYIIASLLFIGLLKYFSKQFYFITLILCLLSSLCLYNQTPVHSINYTLEITIGFLPFGLVRGLFDISVGILSGKVVRVLKRNPLGMFSAPIELFLLLLCGSVLFIPPPRIFLNMTI